MTVFRTNIGENIFRQKYGKVFDSWEELAAALAEEVCGGLLRKDTVGAIAKLIEQMKFIPGGRYLYYAGRPVHAYSNCFLLRAEEDTREDWANLSWQAESCLMTGGGIGVDYSRYRGKGLPLSRTGGQSSGPVPKMMMINEIGRHVMQGGSRRSAIWAGLHAEHADIMDFMHAKDWEHIEIPGTGKTYKEAKEANFNCPAPLDMTNISVIYDDASQLGGEVWLRNVRQALVNGEPGMAFNFNNPLESLRNAPVSANTWVRTSSGYRPIWATLGQPLRLWTGRQWVTTEFKKTKSETATVVVRMSNDRFIVADPTHEFLVRRGRNIHRVPAIELALGEQLVTDLVYEEKSVFVIGLTKGPIEDVYCCDVGVEEHSFCAEGVIISNCTEVVSEDNADVCNLGSLNLSRISTLEEMRQATALATAFLLCGTIRGDLPYEKVYKVREQNRRLGLGLMGVHEWLLQRGYRYEVVPELHDWLYTWELESDHAAFKTAFELGVSQPVAVRSIAPTGTIGLIAGTTTGIEPLFAVAYKRRYLKGQNDWHYQYVIDGTAKELIGRHGVNPDSIESAIDLAADSERRIAFQADVQDYTDQAISSTINLPAWGTELNNEDRVQSFAETLARYASRLRGFTCYPSGSRGGQPLTAVPYQEAMDWEGVEFQEHDSCKDGVCGI